MHDFVWCFTHSSYLTIVINKAHQFCMCVRARSCFACRYISSVDLRCNWNFDFTCVRMRKKTLKIDRTNAELVTDLLLLFERWWWWWQCDMPEKTIPKTGQNLIQQQHLESTRTRARTINWVTIDGLLKSSKSSLIHCSILIVRLIDMLWSQFAIWMVCCGSSQPILIIDQWGQKTKNKMW